MIDVRRLRVLVEIAERGSLAAAADALGYSASAVSQQLMRLEQELGVELVERGVNSLMLTEAGRVLAARGPAVLAEIAATEAEVRAAALARAEGVRIATFASAGPAVVAPVVRALRNAQEDTIVSVVEGDPEDTLPLLRSGMADLALTYEYDHVPAPLDDRLRRELLLLDPMRLVVPLGHPLAARTAALLADAAEDAWIAEPRADCMHFTVHACAAAGFDARVSALSSDYETTQALVAAGVGLALVPAMALLRPRPDVAVRPLHGEVPLRRVFVTTRRQGSRRRLKPVLRLLRQAVDDLQAAERRRVA